MQQVSRIFRRLQFIVALLVVSVPMSVRSAEAPAILATLYQAAKVEGSVELWGSNREDLDWIVPEFEKSYPGIKVKVVTDMNITGRALTENRLGRHSMDVMWNSVTLTEALVERGLIAVAPWKLYGLPETSIGLSGHMAFTSSMAYVFACNTGNAPISDAPTTWSELAHPKYRGKVAASPFLIARLLAAIGSVDGEDAVIELAKRLRSDADILWTNDLLEQVLRTGERACAAGVPYYLVDRWRKQTPNLSYRFPSPAPIAQFGTVVAKSAPHPAAARLLAYWMASDAGRSAREKALFAIDLQNGSKSELAQKLRDGSLRFIADDPAQREVRNRLIGELDKILTGR